MAKSAEALGIVRDHVARHGYKLRLREVIKLDDDDPSGDEIAGTGFDRVTKVHVPVTGPEKRTLDKLYPGGALSGVLACRAVLLEPGAAEHPMFVGQRVTGAMHLRTRFQAEEPAGIPGSKGAITAGGTLTRVAIHNLMQGDGAQLDEYFAAVEAYEADRSAHGPNATTERPAMPDIRTKYILAAPPVPNFNRAGMRDDIGQNYLDQHAARTAGYTALVTTYPAARVLSLGEQGSIQPDQLMDWAVALTSEAA